MLKLFVVRYQATQSGIITNALFVVAAQDKNKARQLALEAAGPVEPFEVSTPEPVGTPLPDAQPGIVHAESWTTPSA